MTTPTYPIAAGNCHPDAIYAEDFAQMVDEAVCMELDSAHPDTDWLAKEIAQRFLEILCDVTDGRLLVTLSEEETREHGGNGA